MPVRIYQVTIEVKDKKSHAAKVVDLKVRKRHPWWRRTTSVIASK
jgi:hypothetical protein